MALMDNKKTYDFETYAPSVLGTAFKRVEILGSFPYETAIALSSVELHSLHAEIYSLGRLPSGTPDDPRRYDYYRIKKADGSITIIGEPWIDQSTIVEVTSGVAVVTIPKMTASDVIRIRDMFTQAGIVDFQIEFK